MIEKDPQCPICHRSMGEVEISAVPLATFQANLTFHNIMKGKANLKEIVGSALTGWFWCPECNEYNHLPTVELMRSYALR